MTTPLCTKADVKSQMAGVGGMSSDWDDAIDGVILAVSAEVYREIRERRGITAPWEFVADATATERRFTGIEWGRRWLPIDDCVEVAAVDHDGTALEINVDVYPDPLNGTPITALRLASGVWTAEVAKIGVTAKWGYATSLTEDMKQAGIRETIKAYLAARAGNDDRLGMTPFGRVITAKAFTDLTKQTIASYGRRTGGYRA